MFYERMWKIVKNETAALEIKVEVNGACVVIGTAKATKVEKALRELAKALEE